MNNGNNGNGMFKNLKSCAYIQQKSDSLAFHCAMVPQNTFQSRSKQAELQQVFVQSAESSAMSDEDPILSGMECQAQAQTADMR